MSVNPFTSFALTSITPEVLQGYWKEIQETLKEQNQETTTQNWVSSLNFVGYDGGKILLSAPTRFARDWIRNNLGKSLLESWKQVVPGVLIIEFVVGRHISLTPVKVGSAQSDSHVTLDFKAQGRQTSITINQDTVDPFAEKFADTFQSPPLPPANQSRMVNNTHIDLNWVLLNQHFTFDNFVVGSANKIAYKAARRLAEGAVNFSFNPLCISGASGLGKTHLMHAIAHEIRKNSPEKKVMYLSAEQFMFRFVDALRNKDTQTFKQQFRSVDVMLVDDFQFIAGKESTQNEFFHTFNALIDNQKKIVISADRIPHEISDIEERIRSRLSSGLIVDMGEADYDLRLGVLKSKRHLMEMEYPNVTVPDDVVEFLASSITSNVRELEGALNRLLVHADFVEQPIEPDMVYRVIGDLLKGVQKDKWVTKPLSSQDFKSLPIPSSEEFLISSPTQRSVLKQTCSADKVFSVICDYYGVTFEELVSSSRLKKIVMARQVAMGLLKIMTSLTLVEIGNLFGGRDHSTVVHALRKIDELQKEYDFLKEFVALQEKCLA